MTRSVTTGADYRSNGEDDPTTFAVPEEGLNERFLSWEYEARCRHHVADPTKTPEPPPGDILLWAAANSPDHCFLIELYCDASPIELLEASKRPQPRRTAPRPVTHITPASSRSRS